MNRKQRRRAAKTQGRGKPRGRGSESSDRKLQEAVGHHQAGRLAEATQSYREILSREPDNAVALHFLGVIRRQEGDAGQAIDLIGKAIALQPGYAEAHNNLGTALNDQGRLEEAAAAHRRALELKPDYAQAHYNLGNALRVQGKLEEAAAAYCAALALRPDDVQAYGNLGRALRDLGKLDEAAAACRKAVALRPNVAETHNNLGTLLWDQGEIEEAVASYRAALALKPDYAHAHSNLGNALRVQGKLEETVAAYHAALALQPDIAEVHSNLGIALRDQGRLDESVAACRRALELQPDFAAAHSNLLFTMNYDAHCTAEEIFAESRAWDARHAAPRATRIRPLHNPPDPERRLRVGYVSPDLRTHSVSYFAEPLLANHDSNHVEVFCYAEVARPDETTLRFQALADGWRSTVGLTDAEVAARIRADSIDILVDLAGHTGNNRLLAFAERPAPVQVSWLGYPNTTGMTEMDYRLTDAIADPEGAADARHSETLLRLPDGFLCFQAPTLVPTESPDVAPVPAIASGHVTFGSFNNLPKTGPQVVEVWAQVLRDVPGSRLLMKSGQLRDENQCEKFRETFAAFGIAGERIEFMPKIPALSDHLAAYGRVDIALDPFPYNGTTTTCEAAWMGVPTIALRGARHAARVGASILTQLGLTELIAETTESYVEIAASLARDLDRLANLRSDLRPRLQASPLCDAQGFCRNMERAYRDMWRRWCGHETLN